MLGVSSWVADREVDLALDLRARPHLLQSVADGRSRPGSGRGHHRRRQRAGRPGQRGELADLVARSGRHPGRRRPGPGAFRRLGDGSDHRSRRRSRRVLGPDGFPADCADPRAGRAGSELWAIPANRLRTILRREVARLEPAAAAERAQAARSDRRVVFDDQPDFMSELHLGPRRMRRPRRTPTSTRRRGPPGAGDPRTLDQLRSDISIGWLTEGAFGTLVTRPAAAPPTREVRRPERCGPAGGSAWVGRGSAPSEERARLDLPAATARRPDQHHRRCDDRDRPGRRAGCPARSGRTDPGPGRARPAAGPQPAGRALAPDPLRPGDGGGL